MNRNIVYPGAIPLDTDILSPQQEAMIGLGALAAAAFGTGTLVDGLAGTQTTVASMTINIGPGSILSLQEVDATAYGSLGTNTNALVKQGVNLTTTTFTLTAPGTSGQSINYLVEAAFSEVDGTPVVLPYVNPASPSSPYSGPSNSGTAQNTIRAQTVALSLKAGAAATTGTQTTPATDTGYVPLYVITVAYGQTSITTSQITTAPAAPFISLKIPAISSAVPVALTSTGTTTITPTANRTVVYPQPTGAATITVNPGSQAGQTVTVFGNGSSAITVSSNVTTGSPAFNYVDGTYNYSWSIPSGPYAAGITLTWNGAGWNVQTFGQTVVAPAVVSNQAVNLGQALQILKPSTSTTITPTALQTIVFPSAASTQTIAAGSTNGQRVRVYGVAGAAVTVASSVSSGSPFIALPDSSVVYSWVIASASQADTGIDLTWDGTNWRAVTFGQTVVSPAVASNEAVNLGQAQADFAALNGSASNSFSVAPATASAQAPQSGQVVAGNNVAYINQTASRAIGTVYTNSGARPMQVVIFNSTAGNQSLSFAVAGVTIAGGGSGSTVTKSGTITAIVPVGATYELTGSGAISTWMEL